jgi:hypothetical protein
VLNKFDPEESEPGSSYNLHHSVAEATPEEVSSLLHTRTAALDPEPGLKKGFYLLFIRLEPLLQMQLGSDYGDPRTDLFLKAWLAKFGDLPEGTRRSWASMRSPLSEAT